MDTPSGLLPGTPSPSSIPCRHVRPAPGDVLPDRCMLAWGHEGDHRAMPPSGSYAGTGASWPSDEQGQQPPTWKPFALDVA